MADDLQLLRRYAETRASEAFAALVERHIGLVYWAALRQLDGAVHRAEDVTQSVFIDLARQAGHLSRRDEIVGWLYTSTRYAAANLQRSEARRQQREQEARTMQELNTDAAASVEWERLRPVLDDAMHELGERDRQAILLRFFQNEPFSAVGQKIGASDDAARMRVDRALGKLQTLLRKRGITSTSTALATALGNQALASAPAGLAAQVTGAALAVAGAVATGSLVAVVQFMSATKTIVTLAVAACLVAGFAALQSTHAWAAMQRKAELIQERAALTARVADLQTEVTAAESLVKQQQAARASAAQSNAASVRPAVTAVATEQGAARAQAQRDFINADPELRALRREGDRLSWIDEFLPQFRALGMTPEQVERVSQDYAQRTSLKQSVRAVGGSPDGMQLGPLDGFPDEAMRQRFVQSASAWAERIVVESLATYLYHLSTPLTSTQAEQLIATLEAASPKDRGRNDSGPQWVQRAADWDRVLAAAGQFLTPEQMQGLRGLASHGRMLAQTKAVEQPSR